MDVLIEQGIEGAKNAEGLAVIVDVFRAASVSAYLLSKGVKKIIPAKDIDETLKLFNNLKGKGYDVHALGEKDNKESVDFDLANSPYLLDLYTEDNSLEDSIVVQTSTNGINGMIASSHSAQEVISACFVNYQAVKEYVSRKNPELVTIVSMGELGENSIDDDSFSKMFKEYLEGVNIAPEKFINTINTTPVSFFRLQIIHSELNNLTIPDMIRKLYEPQQAQGDIKRILNPYANLKVVPGMIESHEIINVF